MQFAIKRITSRDELSLCASMMISSNPWNKLYFTREQCEADLTRSEICVSGAIDDDGKIQGFLAAVENGIGFEPLIEYLCVDERLRGSGIGSSLIQYFEDELFPDADNLYLFVSDINPQAIRLYVRLGYLQIGALPNFNLVSQTEFLHRKSRRPRQEAQMKSQREVDPH